jgi:hypothetical protein
MENGNEEGRQLPQEEALDTNKHESEKTPPKTRRRQRRWQKDFNESDYQYFLRLAQQRTDVDMLKRTLDNIQGRLRGAEMANVLPQEGEPTKVARDDFTGVEGANSYIGRIYALRSIATLYGKKDNDIYRLKYRKTTFESKVETEDEKLSNVVVFSVKTEFPFATIGLKMTGNENYSVQVIYPKEAWEDEYPSYQSGFLPADSLTHDELLVLAQHAVEVGFYNIYGDPSKSPYPWENQLS